ncbi:MAG: peptide chain release factor N(5)-glutamine methyltransferase [Deltaproteobacteria bacterium]|nr:peptide chain release factor N(5)-glutamine methyltransferase [Deltaproteobacteria bacterium]
MNEQAFKDSSPRTVRAELFCGVEILRRAGIESARLDAEVLMCHALAASRTELYVRFEQLLAPHEINAFQESLQRRARHEPAAYISGAKEFWSLEFAVDTSVLIPRPETELLVEWTLSRARKLGDGRSLKILDLGTGSGAIAVALATELPEAQMWASDVSPAALAVARSNAKRHGVERQINFLSGDLFEPLMDHDIRFDLMVSNPPYIASRELAGLPPEVRDYEPVGALNGGKDGLAYYRRIVAGAARWLAPGGSLLCEIGADQGQAVAGLIVHADGFDAPEIHQDLAGKDRVVIATKGGAGG